MLTLILTPSTRRSTLNDLFVFLMGILVDSDNLEGNITIRGNRLIMISDPRLSFID